MQRKIYNIFRIYTSEHLIKHKKLLAYFSFETKLKIQLTTNNKSDFRSWKKGSYDDDFDVDWVTWNELKVGSGCSRLYTATKTINDNWIKHHEYSLASRQRICLWHRRYCERNTHSKYLFTFRISLKQESMVPQNSLSTCYCSLFISQCL